MREIIFRGKRKDNKEWVEGYLVRCGEDLEDCFIFPPAGVLGLHDNDYGLGFYNAVEVLPETVGQYTGLKDKNGKRIFEGDIIRYADMYDYNCYLESLDNIEAYDKWDLGNIWTIDEVVHGFKIGYPAFDLNKHDWEINGLANLNESGQFYYEVIGNIHSNPELLE